MGGLGQLYFFLSQPTSFTFTIQKQDVQFVLKFIYVGVLKVHVSSSSNLVTEQGSSTLSGLKLWKL